MITGLSHLTFIVKDLERSAALFREVFGAEEVYDSGGHQFSLAREKFLIIQGLWVCLMAGEPLGERTYNHVAFQIEESEMDAYRARLQQAGVALRPERLRITGEGQSIYFYDFDNHLFELHAGTLTERLKRYALAR